MTASADPPASPSAHCPLHSCFLRFLPRIEEHGRVYFRHVRCRATRDEALAEMRGLCWQWFVRLQRRGKDVSQFVSALATYAARAVRGGRRVCGQERAKDALSPAAARRHGFAVGKLPECSSLAGSPLEEALRDNTHSDVPDQVAFRLDFPAWRRRHGARDRRLIDLLTAGERALDISRAFGLSPARVSQKRRRFLHDWERFHAGALSTTAPLVNTYNAGPFSPGVVCNDIPWRCGCVAVATPTSTGSRLHPTAARPADAPVAPAPRARSSVALFSPNRRRCSTRNHRASSDRAVWWCQPTQPRVSYSSKPHSPLAA
jgi:hypothetical protein